jgi:hypothetical protein
MKKLTIALAMTVMFVALVVACAVGASSTTAAPPQGRVVTMTEAGIQFQLPSGWKTKRDADAVYLSTADEALQVVFFVPDSETYDMTLRALDKELGRTIKNVKTTEKDSSDTLNGMRHFSTGGTGEVDGSGIEWGVDIFDAKKPVIALFFADPGAFNDYSKGVDQFLESVKKISTAGNTATTTTRAPAAPPRNDRILYHDEAGFQFELPLGWRAKEVGNDMLIETADGTVQLDIWIPESSTFELALRNIDRDLSKVVKNARVLDRGTSDTHNGMRHFATSGTGTVSGFRCEWSVDILEAKKTVLILSYWRPGIADRHAAEGIQFINSIKLMK